LLVSQIPHTLLNSSLLTLPLLSQTPCHHMSTNIPDETAVIAAANVHWTKLRLSRISAALDFLQALRTAAHASHVQSVQCKEQYLLDLQRAQHLLQSDARHFTIVASRKEATSTAGLPQWQLYMERLVYYRHMGRMFCQVGFTFVLYALLTLPQAQPDGWRDEVLEHVEAMSQHTMVRMVEFLSDQYLTPHRLVFPFHPPIQANGPVTPQMTPSPVSLRRVQSISC
jgi:hypothetical protein